MKNKNSITDKIITADKGLISSDELLHELKRLLDDMFIGNIVLNGHSITYKLLNGQTFTIAAEKLR